MRQKVRRSLLLVSMVLFPVTMNFLSPVIIVFASLEGVIAGSFLFFGLLFVGSLLLGRAFCGWACPAAGVQEACFPMNGKRVRGRAPLVKYIIWVPWLAAIAAAATSAGGYRQINPLFFTETGVSVDSVPKLIVFIMVFAAFFVLSVTIGKRAGCHTICWMAPFMVLGRRLGTLLHIPGLKLRVQADHCTNCKACENRCPMSLPVNAMVQRGTMEHDDCILCGQCVDTCSKKVLQYGYGIRKPVSTRQKAGIATDQRV